MSLKIDFNFVPFPREIWDKGIELSHNGFKLLGYLIRHTVSFQNREIKLTDDEFINGRKRTDGNRYDNGCGIKSVNGLKAAREELEELGWLKIETDNTDKARIKRFYTLNLEQEDYQPTIPDHQSLTPEADSRVSNFDTQPSTNDTRTYNRNLKQETKKKRKKEDVVTASPDNALKSSLLGLLELQPEVMNAGDWKNFHQLLGGLKKLNATVEQVEVFRVWFYDNHWKGQRGEKPNCKDVRENWKTAFLPAKSVQKRESQTESKGDRNVRYLKETLESFETDPFWGNNTAIETSPRLLGAVKTGTD